MKKIIPVVVFIAMTAAVIWWVWPEKSGRNGINSLPPKPVPFTMTNEKGETFTVYVSGAIIHGTNVPLTNGNISFTVSPKDK
jgi:hypothetical protein